MPNYDPTTGHTVSPQRNWGEDSNLQHEYSVDCDGRVAYRVRACDAWTAERKARKLYYNDCGQYPDCVNASW